MRLLSIDVGIKNLAICRMTDLEILNWEVGGVPPKHEDGVYMNMKKYLDERPWVLDVDKVIIERQPDRNKGMKAVENFLHAYFVIHDRNVQLWDARHKVPDVVGAGKKKYTQRKATAITRCQEKIQGTTWVQFFETHKKKDDLADSFMQGLSYFQSVQQQVQQNQVKKKPRKPTESQKQNTYSRPNLAWLYKNAPYEKDVHFERDLKKYYKSIDDLVKDFFL
jgi:hypothetical protein